MKVVGIVCEYNPFHLGHAHQISEIRKTLGEDTAIVALMSGNYVQRGEPAILGKFERARAAVEAGVSLVLELPFPYSASSAEYFGRAAVSILDSLGIIDILSFGSECGDTSLLSDIAEKTRTPAFEALLKNILKSPAGRAMGYARAFTEAYQTLFGIHAAEVLNLPNNILAISYISAIKERNSSIDLHTVLRCGTDKDGNDAALHAGATYLREEMIAGRWEQALVSLPSETHALWNEARKAGRTPASAERLSPALLSHLRLCDPASGRTAAECGGGLYEHLARCAREATDLSSLLTCAATKKYTDARIRRALLFSFIGVTPTALRQSPQYTQVLATDERGRALLAHIRKSTSISVLTKPADIDKLSAVAQAQATLSYRADSVYGLASPVPQRADAFLCTAPYLK